MRFTCGDQLFLIFLKHTFLVFIFIISKGQHAYCNNLIFYITHKHLFYCFFIFYVFLVLFKLHLCMDGCFMYISLQPRYLLVNLV